MTGKISSKVSRTSGALILIAAVAAITAAYLLLPDDRTQAAMAMRNGHYSDALVLFERIGSTERDPNRLIVLYRLYVHFGEPAKAGAALRQFVDQNPAELWALKELVTHYRQAHDQDGYLGTLRELIGKEPTRHSFAVLMGQYRLSGDVDAELDLFDEGQRLGLVVDDDVVRAGLILASQGKIDKAAELLGSVDLSRNSMRESIQINLLEILVDLSRFDEAFDLAVEIQRNSPASERGALSSAFERAGRADYAARLRRAVRTVPPSETRS